MLYIHVMTGHTKAFYQSQFSDGADLFRIFVNFVLSFTSAQSASFVTMFHRYTKSLFARQSRLRYFVSFRNSYAMNQVRFPLGIRSLRLPNGADDDPVCQVSPPIPEPSAP